MIALLRQRNYALLWFSQLISQLGNWALFAALPFSVLQLTGSVMATGIMFIVEVLPKLLLGSVAGVFVDRWDRKWTMMGANVARGLLLLLLLAFRSAELVWVVYVVAFFASTASLFYGPANNALLPQLVANDELVTANSLDALGENVARILGPAFGGAILAFAGLGAVALIDVGSYLVGAALIFLIQSPSVTSETRMYQKTERSIRMQWVAFWREWLAGLKLVGQRPALSPAFLAIGIALVGDSILGVLLVVFVQDVIGAGAQQFGWVLTARGLGGVMGGLAVARIGHHIRPRNLMACGMAGTGILLLIMVQFPVLPVMIVAGVAVGLPAMAWLVAGQTWLQAHTEDSYRGRVFGAFETYSALMGLLGIGLATFSGEALGAVLGMYISAFLFIAGGLFCYFLLRPRIPEAGAVKGKALT